MSDVTVERVLRAVEQVPPGRVVAYGDIATLVGTSPRRVGTIMSHWGGEVSWWRVTNAAGRMPAHLLPLARKQWKREGIDSDGERCLISRCRADLDQLTTDYRSAVSDLVNH